MRYRFGEYSLDTDTLELLRAGTRVDVEPQVFDVLAHLIAQRERVVPKEELLDTVWGSQFVSESALTTRIKQARQAVGDDGRAQRVIRTAHGRGYRFVAETTEETAATDEAAGTDVLGAAPAPTHAAAAVPTSFPSSSAVVAVPRTHYARNGDVSIAYQVFGEGPPLVFIAGFGTNVEVQWEHPGVAAFLRRLGSFSRVVVFDKRGTGLSDRLATDDAPSLEDRADDVRAVMDAVGMERATIFGSSEGGALSVLFAAAHPERVERLILHGTWARHPWYGQDRREFRMVERYWGRGSIYGALAESMAATPTGRDFLARYERMAVTPGTARRLLELSAEIDVTPVLSSISVPTLVVHRRDEEVIPPSCAEDLAAGIPGARLELFPGRDHFVCSGDTTPILDAVEAFVVGAPQSAPQPDRLLATVLFADVVDSTGAVQRLGDRRWTDLLDRFQAQAATSAADAGGEVVATTGDGLVAIFDGPGRAVRAGCALLEGVRSLGLDLRIGIHTAEIERRGDDIAGIGVHIASRVADAAPPGRVWVSRTVTDLVAGCGLGFEARGEHTLKGLDEPWMLYEVVA